MLRCFRPAALLLTVLPAGLHAQQFDRLFGGSAFSALLNDQLGSAVLAIVHPLCKHDTTAFDTQSGGMFRFTTKYKFLSVSWLSSAALRILLNSIAGSMRRLPSSSPLEVG
jgi:hypothetical protein